MSVHDTHIEGPSVDSMRDIACGQVDLAAGLFRRLVNYPKFASPGDDLKPRGGQRTLEDGTKVLPLIVRDGEIEKFIVGHSLGPVVCRYVVSEQDRTIAVDDVEPGSDLGALPFPEARLSPLDQAQAAASLQRVLREAFRYDAGRLSSAIADF